MWYSICEFITIRWSIKNKVKKLKLKKIKYLTKNKKNPQVSDIEEIIPNARIVAGGYGPLLYPLS